MPTEAISKAMLAMILDVCMQNRAADSHGFGVRNELQASQQRENIRLLCRPLVLLCASEGDAHGENTGRGFRPAGFSFILQKLLIMSPAPVSRTIAVATSVTTRRLRIVIRQAVSDLA
jgi:hypothetical protein